MARHGRAVAGGVSITFTDHGGDGIPLVLVHATGFHSRVFDPLLPLLDGYRVVTLDQRGHGDSDKPESGYEWEKFASDVLAVVDETSLPRPVFGAGHSAGGAAVLMAEGLAPGTFSRLALMDPVISPPNVNSFMAVAENPMANAARRRRAVWESADQMLERIRTNSPMASWLEEFRVAYVTHGTRPHEQGGIELKCPPHIEAQVYEMSNRHRGWQDLGEVAAEVLLVVGENSPMWAAPQREAASRQMLRGTIEVIEGGGHFFPMERPEKAASALTRFLTP